MYYYKSAVLYFRELIATKSIVPGIRRVTSNDSLWGMKDILTNARWKDCFLNHFNNSWPHTLMVSHSFWSMGEIKQQKQFFKCEIELQGDLATIPLSRHHTVTNIGTQGAELVSFSTSHVFHDFMILFSCCDVYLLWNSRILILVLAERWASLTMYQVFFFSLNVPIHSLTPGKYTTVLLK